MQRGHIYECQNAGVEKRCTTEMSAVEDDTRAAPLSDRYDLRSPSCMHVAGDMVSRWSD